MIIIAKKERKQTLFKRPKHKYLAKIITFKSVTGAEKSVKKSENLFKEAKTKKKKLRIARAIQYAENRIKYGFLAKKNLKKETKVRLKKIANIYEDSADRLWKEYDKLG